MASTLLETLPEIWPEGQRIEAAGDPNIAVTHFVDPPAFHSSLIQTLLMLEGNSSFTEPLVQGSCGVKIHHVDRWNCPEAQLVHQRALALFRHGLHTREAHVDASWASIYRKGDYCVPHSHIRAQASIVYMVAEGDAARPDDLAGKLCFTDPRLGYCAQHEPGRLTRMLIPVMQPGSMVMFPGATVHCVNPYMGNRPRITMSWNINVKALPGDPRQTFERGGA